MTKMSGMGGCVTTFVTTAVTLVFFLAGTETRKLSSIAGALWTTTMFDFLFFCATSGVSSDERMARATASDAMLNLTMVKVVVKTKILTRRQRNEK